ncbi:MAG: GNAT family N-acetyltransferase [Lachnospiraceae bacterium]
MNIMIRAYQTSDLPDMIRIWNEVVEDGAAFPQEDFLNEQTGSAFFAEQTCTAVAADSDTGKVYGLYILHPNNIGRCGHICNASYAVSQDSRGLHIGEKLVSDCLKQGAVHGFRPLINDFLRKMAKFRHQENQDVSAGTRIRFFIDKPAAMISFPRAVIKYL